MNDEYDVIVNKTVRDLFKSNTLTQIDQYKKSKLKEIEAKDEELKKLILEKYSSLINSIDSLEQISSNLKELQEIRRKLEHNLTHLNLSEIETTLNNIKFDENFINEDEYADNANPPLDIDAEFDAIESLLLTQQYQNIINKMNNIKTSLNSSNPFAKERYDFFLVDICEKVMNDIIKDDNLNDKIDFYKNILDQFDSELIIDDMSKGKLNYSSFYLKIQSDEGINEIFKKFFSIEDKIFSIDLLIRLLILKLTQNLILLSNCKDDNFISEENALLIYGLFKIVLSISIIIKQYIINDANEVNVIEGMKSFFLFIQSEITTNISTLIVISKQIQNIKNIKCDELIHFWSGVIFKMISSNVGKEEEIRLFITEKILSNDKSDIVIFLFANKIVDQISNCTSQFMKVLTEENFTKVKQKKHNNNRVLLIFKEVAGISNEIENNNILSIIKKKIVNCLLSYFSSFLDKIYKKLQNEHSTHEYMNFIMKTFSHSELQNLFTQLQMDNINKIINNISELYIQSNFKQIEEYIKNTFKEFLHYELFSTEDDQENDLSITNSMKELLIFLSAFEIRQIEYKAKIYSLIYEVYKDILSISSNSFNPKIIIDVNILNNITISDIKFDDIIKVIEEKCSVNNSYNSNNLPSNIIGKKELENFFYNEAFFEDEIEFPVMQPIVFNYKYNSFRKEMFAMYNNKLNVYLLNKSKNTTNQQNQSSLYSNSTAKILEHRIDENYLSLRPSKTQSQSQPPNNINVNVNVNMRQNSINTNIIQGNIADAISQLSGKWFNLSK